VIHATVEANLKKMVDDAKSKMDDIFTFKLPGSPMEYHIKLR
jgi:hypothetical protein